MGIKNIAHKILDSYPKEFIVGDFQHNKLKVAEMTDVQSKIVRNRIAGYVTRILSPRERKIGGDYDPEQ